MSLRRAGCVGDALGRALGVAALLVIVASADRADAQPKATAPPAPAAGPTSELIWAPELHRVFDTWVIFFAAAPSREIKHDLFQHRMWAITTTALNPLEGTWSAGAKRESR